MPHSSPPGAPIAAIRLLARQAERGTLRPVIPPEQRDRLGYTDLNTTSRYLHVIPGERDKALDALDRAMAVAS